ncbi:MAG: hypothetical protein MUO23_06430 [Anaerolineales bacterium]|nr:hypothetical protein [Anaerolineales bacterium]
MLPVIGLVALLLYLVLWKSGALKDLASAAGARQSRKKAKPRSAAVNERSRLNVFEEFIERMAESDEPPEPKDPQA